MLADAGMRRRERFRQDTTRIGVERMGIGLSTACLRRFGAFCAALVFAFTTLAPPVHAQGAAPTIIRDTETEETLRLFSDPLLRAAGLQPEDVEITLIGDPSINAFVANGQNMFFHSGLIMRADTPNQLKGVIAHEIGHIYGGDIVQTREAMSRAMRPALLAIGLGILAIAAGAPDAGAYIISGGSQQAMMASFLPFRREQESQADANGLKFLEETGQSGRGLIEFFEKFRSEEVMSLARRTAYFRTHPLASDRIDALRQKVEASAHKDTKDSADDIRRFELMKAKLRGFIDPPNVTYRNYPDKDTSIPARYARAIAACGCGLADRSPDIARAKREMDALIAAEPNNPYFQEIYGQILFEHGDSAGSLPYYRRAVELAPNAPLIQVNLARSILAARKSAGAEEAIAVLERAARLDPENPFTWKTLAEAYDMAQLDGQARLASAEQYYWIGDLGTARHFAERARRALENGTPAWRRASDIITQADNIRRGARGNDRRDSNQRERRG
jgi:predicted Zn-dependent protease